MAKEFGLQAKGETQDFKGLHYASMTDEQRKALADYCLNDVDLETKLFKILLPKLSNPAIELRLMRHTLDMWLHRGFDFDRDLADSLKVQMYALTIEAVNKTGLVLANYDRIRQKYAVRPPKKYADKSVSYLATVYMAEAREAAATDLRGDTFVKLLQTQGERVEWKQGKRGNVAALAKTDDYAKSLMVHGNPVVRDLMTARMAVKSWPLHTKRIESMEKQSAANGGILRVPLNYAAAHTLRWGGGEGINLHNLGGRGRAGSGVDPLIGKIRGLLRAPAGFTLGIGDSAQIEARILAWLAGQDDLTTGFANNEDIYSEFATTLFRVPVRKERSTDPKPVGRMLSIKRGFGKDAILGCGFGMGADKFYQRCLQNSSLRPAFDSGQYNRQFIQKLIDTYRTKYSKIPAYWRAVETAFKQVLRFPHLTPKVGNIEFSCVGHEVHVKLPSGHILYYRQCNVKGDGNISYLSGPKRESLWGGSITENLVQSIARDLLGFWILTCEDAGLPVILHVHDEVVCQINKNNSKISLDKLNQILCTIPNWASGLPVGAEVKESEAYCK